MSSCDAPSRTARAIQRAACRQPPQTRFSRTHWAIDTGTEGQGAMSSPTRKLHARRSRGVIGLVSTPGRLISGSAAGAADPLALAPGPVFAVESRQLDHATT